MKKVTFKVNREPIIELTGWLFEYAGLRFVAVQEIVRGWWSIYEYSTGRQANWHSDKTRQGTIKIVKQEFDKRGSLVICQTMQTAIEESGILN